MREWKKYDPTGSKFIPEEDLPKFLTSLKPPLGLGPIENQEVMDRIIEELQIPVTVNNSVFFPDVLLALSERLYDIVSKLICIYELMSNSIG